MIILGLLIVLSAAAVGIVYAAYSVLIDYNYNVTAHADVLEISPYSSSSGFTISRSGSTALRATKADAVIITPDSYGDIMLDGGSFAAEKFTRFFVGDGEDAELYRKSVFIDLPLSSVSDITAFAVTSSVSGKFDDTVTPPDDAVIPLKAILSEAEYDVYDIKVEDDGTTTSTLIDTPKVKYDNIYAGSMIEFELMNFQSNYNNIFELWSNYNRNEKYSRTVYLLDDITITGNYKINVPCSINLLTSALKVGTAGETAALTLGHSYAGAYYITAEDMPVNSVGLTGSGSVVIANGSSFVINTPKAYYSGARIVDWGITVENYNAAEYIGNLLDDALDFAYGLLPDRFYSTLILQQHYQTYGVDYKYYFRENSGAEFKEFSGRVASVAEYGSLLRDSGTTGYEIKIVASKSGASKETTKTVYVIGSGKEAMLENILFNINNSYFVDQNGSLVLRLDVNVLNIIKNEYVSGGFDPSWTITVSVSEDMYGETLTAAAETAVLTTETAVRLNLSVSGGTAPESARSFTLGYDPLYNSMYWEDTDGFQFAAGYLYIEKGITTVSDNMYIKLAAFNGSETVIVDNKPDGLPLATSTQAEVMYYIKSVATGFTTNTAYHVINMSDENDVDDLRDAGLYRGDDEQLSASKMGLKSVELEFVIRKHIDDDPEKGFVEPIDDTVLPYDDPNDDVYKWFIYNNQLMTWTAESPKVDIPPLLYVRYAVTFENDPNTSDDDSVEYIYIEIIKSLAEDGGENQMFESSNPFDELFMSSDTVWVEGGTFTTPSTSPDHYAQIEIMSINGETYDPEDASLSPLHKICSIVYPEYVDADNTVNGSNTPERNGHPILTDYAGNDTYYKVINFVTNPYYIPDYNVAVKVRCYYLNAATPAIVLTQDYMITIPGVFRCEDDADRAFAGGVSAGIPGYGNDFPTGLPDPAFPIEPYVFTDRNFYDLTIKLFEIQHPDIISAYVSTISTGEKYLLSDSAYATANLNYTALADESSTGVDVEGIQRLKRVVTIDLSGIRIVNMRAFSEMGDSSLENLYLANCEMSDSAIYDDPYDLSLESYLYGIHLKAVDLSGNKLTRTVKLLSRTVTDLDMSGQRNGGAACLTDISGLSNLTGIISLDVSDNGIYRFGVFSQLTTLANVYIYDNLSSSDGQLTLYGVDGRINIPPYVAAIKNYGTKIYADKNNLTKFIEIDRTATEIPFSSGGDITAGMEIGSVALNAFAMPVKLYSADAQATLEDDLGKLMVDYGSSSGVGEGTVTSYTFAFYNPNDPNTLSDEIILLENYLVAPIVNGSYNAPVTCSYIVVIKEESSGNILAYREFIVLVYYNYTYSL